MYMGDRISQWLDIVSAVGMNRAPRFMELYRRLFRVDQGYWAGLLHGLQSLQMEGPTATCQTPNNMPQRCPTQQAPPRHTSGPTTCLATLPMRPNPQHTVEGQLEFKAILSSFTSVTSSLWMTARTSYPSTSTSSRASIAFCHAPTYSSSNIDARHCQLRGPSPQYLS